MKFLGVILLCCALLVKGQVPVNGDTTDDPPKTTTEPTTTSTSTSTSTTTSTTTEKPTTPAPTTAKPTPAPTPVPDYPKNSGKWSVEDKTNSSCIVLKAAMQIIISHENKTETVNVPPLAEAKGDCSGSGPQVITLSWESLIPDSNNRLVLTFEENSTTKGNSVDAETGITVGKYALQEVRVTLYFNSTNATKGHADNLAVFQTPLNHSYSCLAEETIKSKDAKLTLKIREVQLEAFRHSPVGHREFSTAVQCPADDATDVVPIAVGAALAGLVVIVLIAYLIGRKRSRARGYQSV